MPISGSGIGTADTKKALLALLTFQSGIGDMAPFVTIALGHSRESQETTGRGGGGVGGAGWGGASFLEEEPFSQGFGEWEESGAEISPEKR